MKNMPIAALCVCLAAAGCETMEEGGSGYLTHSEHRLTSAERAGIQAAMSSYVRTPVSLSGLRASYRLSNGTVAVCGYVSGLGGGKSTLPSLFAGTLAGPDSTSFTPLRVPGKGQDPQRIATVRAYCQAEQINI